MRFKLILGFLILCGCSHLDTKVAIETRVPAGYDENTSECSFNIESVKTDSSGGIQLGIEAVGLDIYDDPDRLFKVYGSLEVVKVTDERFVVRPKKKIARNQKPYCFEGKKTPSGKPIEIRGTVDLDSLDLALFVRHQDNPVATYEYFYDMVSPALEKRGFFKQVEVEFQDREGKTLPNLSGGKILLTAFFVSDTVSEIKPLALNKRGSVERRVSANLISTPLVPQVEIVASACERVLGCEFYLVQRLPMGIDESSVKIQEAVVQKRAKLTSPVSTALKNRN